jgi:hypothetical protein
MDFYKKFLFLLASSVLITVFLVWIWGDFSVLKENDELTVRFHETQKRREISAPKKLDGRPYFSFVEKIPHKDAENSELFDVEGELEQKTEQSFFEEELENLKQTFLNKKTTTPETVQSKITADFQDAPLSGDYFHFFFQDWYIKYLRALEEYMKEDGFLAENTSVRLGSLDEVVEFLDLFADYLAFGENPDDEIAKKQIAAFRKSIDHLPNAYKKGYGFYKSSSKIDFKSRNFLALHKIYGLFSLNFAKASAQPIEGIDVLEKMGISPPDLADILNVSIGDLADILGVPVGNLPDIVSLKDILKTPNIIENISFGNFSDLYDAVGVKADDVVGILNLNSVDDLADIFNAAGLAGTLGNFLGFDEFSEIMDYLGEAYSIASSVAALVSLFGTGGLTALVSIPGAMNLINIPGISDAVGSIPVVGGFMGGFGKCKSREPPLCFHVKNPLNTVVGYSLPAPCCSCYKKVHKKCRPIGCLNKIFRNSNAIFDYATRICGGD